MIPSTDDRPHRLTTEVAMLAKKFCDDGDDGGSDGGDDDEHTD
jgi:hypothetical protein